MQVNLLRKCSSTLLGPSLRVGDVVVLANLAAHKVQGVREALGESGATLLYLPPYSPDFNPIEQAYAKLKALLRKAAAHTVDGLESANATALEAFSPEECANYFTTDFRRTAGPFAGGKTGLLGAVCPPTPP